MTPPKPTPDQCTQNERLPDFKGQETFAAWYPQMGGYCSLCVVTFSKNESGEQCFEVYVWHDGSFPFHDESTDPAHIHHCVAEQFIEFGNLVKSLQEKT